MWATLSQSYCRHKLYRITHCFYDSCDIIHYYWPKKLPPAVHSIRAVCLSTVRSLWTNTLGNVQEWHDRRSQAQKTTWPQRLNENKYKIQRVYSPVLVAGADSCYQEELLAFSDYFYWPQALLYAHDTWRKKSSFRVEEHVGPNSGETFGIQLVPYFSFQMIFLG